MNELDSFSHGECASKVWLCETLEPYIVDKLLLLYWVAG